MDAPWQDAQAPDRLVAPRGGALTDGAPVTGASLAITPLASSPAKLIVASEPAPVATTDCTTAQDQDTVYAPIDISGFRSPMLPKLMREFSPLATVVRRPGAGETATHALDMTDRRAEELAEQAKARSMHLVVLFEQMPMPATAPATPPAPTSPATSAIV